MNCKQITDDYELYALGALGEDRRAEFEAHLAECPEDHPELAEALEAMASVAATAERAPVPDRVAQALFARVDADLGSPCRSAGGRAPPTGRGRPYTQPEGAGEQPLGASGDGSRRGGDRPADRRRGVAGQPAGVGGEQRG